MHNFSQTQGCSSARRADSFIQIRPEKSSQQEVHNPSPTENISSTQFNVVSGGFIFLKTKGGAFFKTISDRFHKTRAGTSSQTAVTQNMPEK